MKLSVEIVPYKTGMFAAAFSIRIEGDSATSMEKLLTTEYFKKIDGYRGIAQTIEYIMDFAGVRKNLFENASTHRNTVSTIKGASGNGLRTYCIRGEKGKLATDKIFIIGGTCIKVSNTYQGTLPCDGCVKILEQLYVVLEHSLSVGSTWFDKSQNICGKTTFEIEVAI